MIDIASVLKSLGTRASGLNTTTLDFLKNKETQQRFMRSVATLPQKAVTDIVEPVIESYKETFKAPARVATIPVDLANEALMAAGITKKPLPPLPVFGAGEAKPVSAKTREYQAEMGTVLGGVRATSEAVLDVAGLATTLQRAGIGSREITRQQIFRGENPTNRGGPSYSFDKKVALRYGPELQTEYLPKNTLDLEKKFDPKIAEEVKNHVDDMINKGQLGITDQMAYKPVFDRGYDAVILSDHMTGERNILLSPRAQEIINKTVGIVRTQYGGAIPTPEMMTRMIQDVSGALPKNVVADFLTKAQNTMTVEQIKDLAFRLLQ